MRSDRLRVQAKKQDYTMMFQHQASSRRHCYVWASVQLAPWPTFCREEMSRACTDGFRNETEICIDSFARVRRGDRISPHSPIMSKIFVYPMIPMISVSITAQSPYECPDRTKKGPKRGNLGNFCRSIQVTHHDGSMLFRSGRDGGDPPD